MDSPESREPNKRVNWLVSGEASLAEDAGHGESGAAGGDDAPGRRVTGGGAGGLNGWPEPSGAWNTLVNSPPWLCAAGGRAAGCGDGGRSKSLLNSLAEAALVEGAEVFDGPGSKTRVNWPRWSASRLAGAGGGGAGGGIGLSLAGCPESNIRVKSPAWSASRPGGTGTGGGDGIGDGGGAADGAGFPFGSGTATNIRVKSPAWSASRPGGVTTGGDRIGDGRGGAGVSETSGGTGVVSAGAACDGESSRGGVSAIFGADMSKFKATHSRKPENGSMGSVTA